MPRESVGRDVALHQLNDGEGANWVGLHGWNGSWRTFAPLADRLVDATLVGVDLPGYGESPPPEEFSLEAVGRSVAASLEEADVLPCSLIGSCSGGIVGLSVAEALGDDLDHFVFLEPFAYVPWYLRLLLVPLAGRLFYRMAFGTAVGRRIADAAMTDDEDTAMMESFADTDLAVPYAYLAAFDDLGDPKQVGDLPGKKHLVYAGDTFEAVRASVEMWQGVWPGASVREIAGAGHLLLEDVPDQIASYVSGLA